MPQPLRRLLVAVNPTAAFGRNRDVGPHVATRLVEEGYDVVLVSEANAHLARRAAEHAVAQGVDAVVAVGGDGMVSLGSNLVAGTGVPLGIVASGTGNDLARGLGLPHADPQVALDALVAALRRPPQRIDAVRAVVGEAPPVWYACVLSAGFDAIVNERANRMSRPRGPSRYTLALVRELAVFRPRRYVLEIDGERREQDAMLVSVANNASLGGGMRIAPRARLDDGLLDVVLVHPLSRARLLAVFPRVYSGRHASHPAVEFLRARKVRIDAEGVVAYADGERLGPLPIDAEVVPAALAVLA